MYKKLHHHFITSFPKFVHYRIHFNYINDFGNLFIPLYKLLPKVIPLYELLPNVKCVNDSGNTFSSIIPIKYNPNVKCLNDCGNTFKSILLRICV